MRRAIDMIKARLEAVGPNVPWVVVGKGPSFDRAKVRAAAGVVVCINDTVNEIVCPDFCILNDLTRTLAKISAGSTIFGVGCFLLPSAIDPRWPEDHTPASWVALAERLRLIGPKAAYFNLNGRVAFPDLGPTIHAFNSTFESAVWLLAHAGVKKIRTSGIDHSSSYHPAFGARDAGEAPFSAVPYYVQVAVDAFGLEVAKL